MNGLPAEGTPPTIRLVFLCGSDDELPCAGIVRPVEDGAANMGFSDESCPLLTIQAKAMQQSRAVN